jgi:hypothetical protein
VKAKYQRDRKRGGNKTRTLILKLTPEENKILCKQANEYKSLSSLEYARFMFRCMLYELECTALEQETVHGVRFAHPEDCTCCKGESH